MSAGQSVIVIGAGGHAKVLVDALQCAGVALAGITDRAPGLPGRDVLGVPVLGDDAVLERHPPAGTLLVNGIGSAGSMQARKAAFERFKALGYRFLAVRHPSAVVARDARIGEGAQILAGAVVQPGTLIGDDSIVNTGARVDHDCTIGRHVHLAPGAILSGNVTIGDATHVGTGAVVIQGIGIGAGCTIAAGAVVTGGIADGARVAGVPARSIAA